MRRSSQGANARAGQRDNVLENREVAYIEALNIGLLGQRQSKGLLRDRALLEEAERLNRSAGTDPVVPSTIPPPSDRATIPPPSWKQSRG